MRILCPYESIDIGVVTARAPRVWRHVRDLDLLTGNLAGADNDLGLCVVRVRVNEDQLDAIKADSLCLILDGRNVDASLTTNQKTTLGDRLVAMGAPRNAVTNLLSTNDTPRQITEAVTTYLRNRARAA